MVLYVNIKALARQPPYRGSKTTFLFKMLLYCCTFCLIVKNESFGYDQSLLQTLGSGAHT